MDKETYQRLYRIFFAMKRRCYNPNNNKYKIYGARGIRICDEWVNNKKEFMRWAVNNGYRADLTVDRIDVNGNYEPNNCRWITLKEQNLNRRNNIKIKYNDNEYYLGELSNLLGIKYWTLYARLKRYNFDGNRLFSSDKQTNLKETKTGQRYIYKNNNSYSVEFKGKYYGSKKTLQDAIKLRDKILKGV